MLQNNKKGKEVIPGFKNWKVRLDESVDTEQRIARVITVNKTNYNILIDGREVLAEASGKLIYSSEGETDLPVAGDFVVADVFDDLAIIHDVLPRFSFLKRKSAGKKVEFQSIAANIDYGFIVQAIDTDFNIRRLERYLAMIYEADIIPVIILTKTDLISEEEKEEKISLIEKNYNELKIFTVCNIDKNGIDEIINILEEDKTYCFLGSSGVGKSTLINNLTGNENLATREVRSSDKKGKHTTTRRELILLNNGSILIDTPGMRELANISIDDGLDETFYEISELIKECKFSDCNHTSDSGCALLNAVDKGIVSRERYDSFIKLKKESEHYESTYYEKKKKDKKFTKMCKTIMKEKSNKR
ncbi:MAG: ribosome small subunit-dependent GTPase A [Rhodothermaceae bacterium]